MKTLFANSTRRQRALLGLCLLAAGVLIILDATVIHAQGTHPPAPDCPRGATKYVAIASAGSAVGYEYGAENAEVTVLESHAWWRSIPDRPARNRVPISRICVKAGPRTFWAESGPLGGKYLTPEAQDITYLVVYMEAPTDVGVSDFDAKSLSLIESPAGFDQRYVIVAIVLVAFVVFAGWTIHDLRKGH